MYTTLVGVREWISWVWYDEKKCKFTYFNYNDITKMTYDERWRLRRRSLRVCDEWCRRMRVLPVFLDISTRPVPSPHNFGAPKRSARSWWTNAEHRRARTSTIFIVLFQWLVISCRVRNFYLNRYRLTINIETRRL